MISSWPVYKEEWNFAADEHAVEVIKEAVRAIRNVRTSMNVPPSRKAKVFVVTEDADLTDIFENSRVFFSTLASASEVVIQKDKTGIGEDAVSAVIPKAAIYMPFAELVHREGDRALKEGRGAPHKRACPRKRNACKRKVRKQGTAGEDR